MRASQSFTRDGLFEMSSVSQSHRVADASSNASGGLHVARTHRATKSRQANSSQNSRCTLNGRPQKSIGRPQRASFRARQNDTGHLAGSASFCRNSAWCRGDGVTGVHYLLTCRIRLQYMRCNGVGGSTCRFPKNPK